MVLKSFRLASSVLMLTVLALGCVSKSTYEQLEQEKNRVEQDKNREISSLQRERQVLQQQRGELQTQIQNLESQRSTLDVQREMLERESIGLQTKVGLLAQDRDTLEQRQKDLQQQVDALEQQKAQLVSASQQTQSQYDSLVRNLTEEVQKGQLQVRQYKNMLTVDIAEQLFLDSGQASLKDSGKEVLKKVGDALKNYEDKIIRIIGHTDNVPIAKSLQKTFPSNWELSAARATTVVRYLQELGVAPERLVATGRAEYAPIAPNDTPEGRKKNRRIEITLIDRNAAQETAQVAK